jgi:hypothetical protein
MKEDIYNWSKFQSIKAKRDSPSDTGTGSATSCFNQE